MKPVKPVIKDFPVVIYAENQPEYIPLPVIKCTDGVVISRWKLSLVERIQVLFFGNIFLSVSTFNKLLQPVMLEVSAPKLTVK